MLGGNQDFIADVMSGDDDAHTSNLSSNRDGYRDDETVVAGEDATLSSLLSESENLVRNFSNLSVYSAALLEDKQNYERRPWQSLQSLRPHQNGLSSQNPKSRGTSDYVSDEQLLPTSARSRHRDTLMQSYSTQNQVQTFPDTASLLQTLKNELVMRTSELHKTEDEYFNLKASFENLNLRFQNSHGELSNLRSQIHSKDKHIRQLSEKVSSLASEMTFSREGCVAAKSELEKMRVQLEQRGLNSDLQNESLSKELKVRDEVIEQLRSELTETTRNSRTSRVSEHTESQLKDKISQLENSMKIKEQKIMTQQRQVGEYEQEIQDLKQKNISTASSKSEISHLEQKIELLKEQLNNAIIKNESLNETLSNSKRFYDEFKETSERSMSDYVRTTQKLKNDYRELEEKHRESLSTIKQRGDNNKRLNDDIKELTEKLKGSELQQSENDRRIHQLNLDRTELTQKIEAMKAQLVESSMMETSIHSSHKKESENKQSYIEKLSQETIQLNRTVDELREKMRIRDSSVEQLNNKLVELEGQRSSQQRSIQNFEEKIYQLTHREKVFENSEREKERKIELLEAEYKDSRDQCESTLEEISKISSEKRELERSLNKMEEKISQEINERAYEVENLRLELKKLTQMLTIEKESGQLSAGEMEKLLNAHNKLNYNFKELSEELENKEAVIKEMDEKEHRLSSHNSYLEEELTKVKMALEDCGEELRTIQKSWDTREDALGVCREDLVKQKSNNVELISKIEQRDQLLQRLTTETGKLKQKYQERNTEIAKLNDQNKRLKESFRDLEASMTELNQKYEEMKGKKEKEVAKLKAETENIQNQYTTCYDEMIQKEEYITKCQAIEKDSFNKFAKLQEDMNRQQIDCDEMEAELNITRSKHRACQEELLRRDEELLRFKTEIQSYQQDVIAFQSERPSFQKEIDRWRNKFSDLQETFQSQQSESENMEDKISEKDQRIDELRSELQVVKQENANHLQTMDQLRMDLGLAKSTNNDRYNHFQSIIESLKVETETKGQEARLLEETCNKYRNEINRLKSDHEGINQSALMMSEEVEHCKEKLRNKEEECQHWLQQTQSAQYLNEEVKISIDTLEKEISQFKQQLEVKEGKLRSKEETLNTMKNEKNQYYKSLLDCQKRLDMTLRDKEDSDKMLEETLMKVKKYEQCIRDLSEELATAQVEMTNFTNKMARLESEVTQAGMMGAHKASAIEALECKVAKMKANMNTYKKSHKTDDTEVENLNSMLLQQTRRCAEVEDVLSCLHREKDMIMEEQNRREKEISEFKEAFVSMQNDIEGLQREREEHCYKFEDVQKKYQHEIKKLKSYSKKVEEDMSSLHQTMGEMQKQMDYGEIQLDKANQRVEFLEGNLEERNKEMKHSEQRLREIEMENRHHESLNSSEVSKQCALQREVDQLHSEVKESRSIILDLSNSKSKFETNCVSLEITLEKTEKKLSQSESELKKMQASFFMYSKELDELKQQHEEQAMVLEKTKDQYGKFSDEYTILKGEKVSEKKKSLALGSEVECLKTQMTNQMANLNMLKEQVEQQEAVIIELQNELLLERKKAVDLQNSEYQRKRAMNEMEDNADVLSRTKQDLKMKVKEKERLANMKQAENDKLSCKVKQYTEALIDRDNKVKLLEKRMQMMEDENIRLRHSLDQIDMVQTPRQSSSDRSEYVIQLESTLSANQTQLESLRSQIRQLNGKSTEWSLDKQMKDHEIQCLKQEKAALQSRVAALSSNSEDLYDSINRKSQCLEEENESLKRMVKTLRCEFEAKDALMLKSHDDSMRNLTSKLSQVQDQDNENEIWLRQCRNEVECKNREIGELKDDNERIIKEIHQLMSEKSQFEGRVETLQIQNTSIVDNFNVWVQEQKVANERLGEKIKEQNKTIQDLRREKETLVRGRHHEYSKSKTDKESITSVSSLDDERITLQNQLITAEKNYEKAIREKNRIIDELQAKVANLLNELGDCQTEQEKMKAEGGSVYTDQSKAMMTEHYGRLRSEAEDYDTKDKQYWIQRVGELTDELQKSREYWSYKTKQMSNHIESSTSADETLTPSSS